MSEREGNPGGHGTAIDPGPADVAAIVRETGADPLRFLRALVDRYGDVVRYPTAFGDMLLLNRPEDVKDVLHSDNLERTSLVKLVLGNGLLASDGDWWRRQRRLMQPAFRPEQVEAFEPIILEDLERQLDDWSGPAERGESVDVSRDMTQLTLRIVVRALFSADMGTDAEPVCEAITTMIVQLGGMSATLFGSPLDVTPDRNRSFHEALDVIERYVAGLIQTRRADPAPPDDLLGVLVNAELDDRQIRDEVVTLLISGHETTALILSWAWHLLGTNEAAETLLHDEVDRLDARPGVEDLPRLQWTRMVLMESMRLYPPVWLTVRRAIADDEIAGRRIPAGSPVMVCAYLVHRHPDYWSDPERFDPERFRDGAVDAYPRYAYFPFGGGRHTCLGNHFALMEGTLLLAGIARRYRVRPTPNRSVEPEPVLTLRQREPVLATLEARAG